MIKKCVLLSLLVFCVSRVAFGGQAEDAILKGNEFVHNKDYDSAIKEYEKAAKADPKNAKAHLLLGLSFANKGDLDKALKFTQYAIMLEKSYAAFNNLGLIYANKGDYQNAIDAYESALKLNATSANAWYQLGRLYASTGNFKDGIAAYKKAIELNPKFDNAVLGLGGAYYWSGDKASALGQADQLRFLKSTDKADQLEAWIKNKEEKKKEVNSKTPSAQPAAVPSPSASASALPKAPSVRKGSSEKS